MLKVKYLILCASATFVLLCLLLWSTTRTTDYYFNDIVQPATTAPLIKILQDARHGDIINIHVTTYGGDMFAGLDLLQAIRDSNATVNVHVSKLAASAGAFLLCGADNVTIDKGALVLFHSFHYETMFGAAPNMTWKLADNDADKVSLRLLETDVFFNCKKILTQEQIDQIEAGFDVVIPTGFVIPKTSHIPRIGD